jgi:hypothetical protein
MSQEKPQTSASEAFFRDITSRVDTAFTGQNARDTATTYLSDLRSRMKDIRDAGRRTVALLLLTAATFELLNRAAISNVQLGPIQVKDLSLIQKALPVVFGYLIYEQTTQGVRYLYSLTIANGISHLFQQPLRATQLDELLNPIGSPLFGPMDWHESDTFMRRLVGVFTIALRTGSIVVALLIEVYSLYQLFKVYGGTDAYVWFSTIFALAFITFAALVVLTGISDKLIRVNIIIGPR